MSSRVSASARVPGPAADVERLWFDLNRWPSFIDGFGSVTRRADEWPQAGRLGWRSTPHGRGHVLETVELHVPGSRFVVGFRDERLVGKQSLDLEEEGDEVVVRLAMEYQHHDANALTAIRNVFFDRRAVRDSLQRTVDRFATERRSDVEYGV